MTITLTTIDTSDVTFRSDSARAGSGRRRGYGSSALTGPTTAGPIRSRRRVHSSWRPLSPRRTHERGLPADPRSARTAVPATTGQPSLWKKNRSRERTKVQ
jgi:hypothetical protein